MSPQYCAGFFDGEGNVDLRFRQTHGGRYKRFELRVTISQVHEGVLHRLKAIYGGSVGHARGNCPRWVVTALEARAFLESVEPYCIVKLDEVRIALEFFRIVEATPAHARPGQHRFSRTPVAIQEQKVVLFHAMRAARAAKGLKGRPDVATVVPYAA